MSRSTGFAYGQESKDKANFAEYNQLLAKRQQLEGEQRLYPEESIFHQQNKFALKKIDERLEELRPIIPQIYFDPENGVRINKSIRGGDPIAEMPRLSLEGLGTRIFALEDAIKSAGPGQDVGAMRRDLEKLREEFGIKAALNRPQKTDRRGFIR
jgi:hypothetical protein